MSGQPGKTGVELAGLDPDPNPIINGVRTVNPVGPPDNQEITSLVLVFISFNFLSWWGEEIL